MNSHNFRQQLINFLVLRPSTHKPVVFYLLLLFLLVVVHACIRVVEVADLGQVNDVVAGHLQDRHEDRHIIGCAKVLSAFILQV